MESLRLFYCLSVGTESSAACLYQRRNADAQTAPRRAGKDGQVVMDAVKRIQNDFGLFKEADTAFCQTDAARRAVKQGQAQFAFQVFNELADTGLGNEEGF